VLLKLNYAKESDLGMCFEILWPCAASCAKKLFSLVQEVYSVLDKWYSPTWGPSHACVPDWQFGFRYLRYQIEDEFPADSNTLSRVDRLRAVAPLIFHSNEQLQTALNNVGQLNEFALRAQKNMAEVSSFLEYQLQLIELAEEAGRKKLNGRYSHSCKGANADLLMYYR
jgi:hypothetical protein